MSEINNEVNNDLNVDQGSPVTDASNEALNQDTVTNNASNLETASSQASSQAPNQASNQDKANDRTPIIQVIDAKKVYKVGNERVLALDGVSFNIYKGEFCSLLGSSGSGKSTLLNIMAGIETISSGQVFIKGKEITKMGENKLAKFRQRYLGFIFQAYNLINSMTAVENVELPLIFKEIPASKRRKMAQEMLIKVGLEQRLTHKPTQMSGGQQQRVGIARAFVQKPEVVFADEPTGNLDSKTSKEVMDIMKKMARDNEQTIVMVTHDKEMARYADKIIEIHDGKVMDIRKGENIGE